MKFEPWVPSFMRRISAIWHADSQRAEEQLPEAPPAIQPAAFVYVYGIQTEAGMLEVRSPKILSRKAGYILQRVE